MEHHDHPGVEPDRIDGHPAQRLSAAQRRRFQVLLQDLWRDQMERLTDLSVRLHGDDLTDGELAGVEQQLAEVRSTLAEIETALQRLAAPTPSEQRSYA